MVAASGIMSVSMTLNALLLHSIYTIMFALIGTMVIGVCAKTSSCVSSGLCSGWECLYIYLHCCVCSMPHWQVNNKEQEHRLILTSHRHLNTRPTSRSTTDWRLRPQISSLQRPLLHFSLEMCARGRRIVSVVILLDRLRTASCCQTYSLAACVSQRVCRLILPVVARQGVRRGARRESCLGVFRCLGTGGELVLLRHGRLASPRM